MKRRFPGFKNFSQLLCFRRPVWNSKERRLSRVLTIYDLCTIAKRRTPRAPFDFTVGAADSEVNLSRARIAFEQVESCPRVLRDVSDVDLSTTMLSKKSSMPLGMAPTGFTRMMQPEGENAGCAAARDTGIPFTLSTIGAQSLSELEPGRVKFLSARRER